MRFTTKTLNQRTEDRERRTAIRHRSSVFRLQGFTLVELVIAIGIMALVILFAGTVFKSSISSYRIASAQAEIMQKFRAITDQLNNDFGGLRKDAPMFIWFQVDDPNDFNKRLDQIMFFADGDFQTTRTYDTIGNTIIPAASGSPVVSNLARIYYGQAQSIDPQDNTFKSPIALRPVDRVLSRRQHLSIANPDSGPQYAEFPTHDSSGFIVVDSVQNDLFEHDTNSLSQWQAAVTQQANVNEIINNGFNRPEVRLANANTLHLLMTQKVGSFSVQWSYFYQDVLTGLTHIYWWPSIDPDGNGDLTDNDFTKMMTAYPVLTTPAFGFYFNTAASSFTNWFSYDKAVYIPSVVTEPAFPRALKFTFTLYDSRGVFKDGQTFTHIVYLGD